MWEDEEEQSEFYSPGKEGLRKRIEEETKKKWRSAAYRGYNLLVKSGREAIDYKNEKEAVLAIRRILGLLVQEEEYEKCNFIKLFLKKEMNIENPQPIYDDYVFK